MENTPHNAGDQLVPSTSGTSGHFDDVSMGRVTPLPPPLPPPRPTQRRGGLLSLALLLVATFSGLPFLAERVQYAITRGRQRAEADVARVRLENANVSSDVFRLAAQCVAPSVVHIESMLDANPDGSIASRSQPRPDEAAPEDNADPSDSPNSKHNGKPAPRSSTPGDKLSKILPFWLDQPAPERSAGQGTGVIVDDEGYILTNYHVVADADRIMVKLSDGRIVRGAQVVGYDAPTDLAVLKIDAGGLMAARWGDSRQLAVGDWVLAVGNPFGLDRSVTAGIVSAKQRRGVILGTPYQDLLQTDAAVNPGNSGGPLVNLRGEIVGINTAILGRTYQGVSFAIPSEVAQEIYEQLRREGAVARGWLGVALREVSPRMIEELDLPITGGAAIAKVLSPSPAQTAGVQVHDIIIRWNDRPISAPEDLSLEVARTEIGSKAEIELIRDGKRLTLHVTVGRRPVMRQ